MTEKVCFPQFEILGPPCQISNCKGVMVNHLNLHTKECFKRCTVCHQEIERMSASQMLENCIETIERVLNNE